MRVQDRTLNIWLGDTWTPIAKYATTNSHVWIFDRAGCELTVRTFTLPRGLITVDVLNAGDRDEELQIELQKLARSAQHYLDAHAARAAS